MHGMPHDVYWTRLAATASAGDTYIIVETPVDWGVGDTILVTSTSYSTWETEKFVITNINTNRNSLTLDHALQYTHLGRENIRCAFQM